MLNKILEHKTEELPSLERFKMLGSKVVVEMKKPVLSSFNLRNLKYFNEIYGTAKRGLADYTYGGLFLPGKQKEYFGKHELCGPFISSL